MVGWTSSTEKELAEQYDLSRATVRQSLGTFVARPKLRPMPERDFGITGYLRALHSIVQLPDPALGHVKMQNVLFRLSETPGAVRWAGRRIGQDNESVYGELGLSPEQIATTSARDSRLWRTGGCRLFRIGLDHDGHHAR